MKKFLLIIIFLISTNSSFAKIDLKECDSIKDKSDKIDCLTQLKVKSLKEGIIDKNLKVLDDKIKAYEEKKATFDEENKTLWKMWKNRKKK